MVRVKHSLCQDKSPAVLDAAEINRRYDFKHNIAKMLRRRQHVHVHILYTQENNMTVLLYVHAD